MANGVDELPKEIIATGPETKVKEIQGKTYRIIEPNTNCRIDGGYLGRGWNFVIDFNSSPHLKALFSQAKAEIAKLEKYDTMINS